MNKKDTAIFLMIIGLLTGGVAYSLVKPSPNSIFKASRKKFNSLTVGEKLIELGGNYIGEDIDGKIIKANALVDEISNTRGLSQDSIFTSVNIVSRTIRYKFGSVNVMDILNDFKIVGNNSLNKSLEDIYLDRIGLANLKININD